MLLVALEDSFSPAERGLQRMGGTSVFEVFGCDQYADAAAFSRTELESR